ncbi:MAG TPA: LacI family DNA-binding transcriptional regulator [Janthinobacterium sp.]|nr:LacI family DNA-binding transcriptional regulator [Janthinobacterium sp.]
MATIKDVALLAGVGLGTASRVVSGKGAVSPATRERVKKAIETLAFRPSHAARTLLSGSSQMIGVYIPVLRGAFYTPILNAIDTELRAAGRHMVVAFGVGDGDTHQQAIEGIAFLRERGCDGLLITSNSLADEDIAELAPQMAKMVVLNHRYEGIGEQCFSADHVQGGVAAAQALLQMRHRQIAVVTGPMGSADNVDRIAGFMAELERAGVDTAALWRIESDFSPEGGWKSAEALMASKHPFTAVFCANDEMAVGALSCFQQAGVAVPGQVSVLGYDDTSTAEYSAPPLTSVHISWRDVTLSGVRHLLNGCYQLALPVQREFPVSVTWRASLAPPADQAAIGPARRPRPGPRPAA